MKYDAPAATPLTIAASASQFSQEKMYHQPTSAKEVKHVSQPIVLCLSALDES
jgi:hypothetical protein